jgi:hypothetical protein
MNRIPLHPEIQTTRIDMLKHFERMWLAAGPGARMDMLRSINHEIEFYADCYTRDEPTFHNDY